MSDQSRIHFEAADLAAYLDRIGYSGPVAADLATLRALQAHQLAALAFENLGAACVAAHPTCRLPA